MLAWLKRNVFPGPKTTGSASSMNAAASKGPYDPQADDQFLMRNDLDLMGEQKRDLDAITRIRYKATSVATLPTAGLTRALAATQPGVAGRAAETLLAVGSSESVLAVIAHLDGDNFDNFDRRQLTRTSCGTIARRHRILT